MIRTGDQEVTSFTAETLSTVIDGTTVTHNVSGVGEAVTIYAVVQDSNRQNLLEMPVDFVATTMPAGIVAQRDLSDDPETAAAETTGTDAGG